MPDMQRRVLATFSLALLGTILVIVAVWADISGGGIAVVWLVMVLGGIAALIGYAMLAYGASRAPAPSPGHGTAAAPTPSHGTASSTPHGSAGSHPAPESHNRDVQNPAELRF